MEDKLPLPFKKKWIKALRSGKYPQGKNYLYNDFKYCCLGVACVIVGFEDIEKKRYIDDSAVAVPAMLHGMEYIPGRLSEMNDEGKSFNEIADYIEENL